MLHLIFAGMLSALQGTDPSDAEHINPDPKHGTSAAVVVADSVPLVHTRQVLAPEPGEKALQGVVQQLKAVLKDAGSSLDRVVKLNFIQTSDGQQEALRKEL